MKTLVISDVHIGSKGCQTDAILDLLKEKVRPLYIGRRHNRWMAVSKI
jgi:hypothetical protein